MGFYSRVKSVHGDPDLAGKTLAAATTLAVPDSLNVVPLTGTATVTSLTAGNYTRGRMVWFYQSDSGTTTFTNSPGTTTAGQMDLGALDAGNSVVGPTDWLCLYLRTDGTWIRVMPVTNN